MLIPETSRKKPARVELNNKVGFVKLDETCSVLVAAGAFRDIVATSVTTETPYNIVLLKLAPGAKLTLPTMPGGCFVYCSTSKLTVNATAVAERTLAIIESGSDDIVVCNVDSAATAQVIFANGTRIEEPWTKLLTQNG